MVEVCQCLLGRVWVTDRSPELVLLHRSDKLFGSVCWTPNSRSNMFFGEDVVDILWNPMNADDKSFSIFECLEFLDSYVIIGFRFVMMFEHGISGFVLFWIIFLNEI